MGVRSQRQSLPKTATSGTTQTRDRGLLGVGQRGQGSSDADGRHPLPTSSVLWETGNPPPYLYMVSASTSPNHTLSPAWKFSPWSSRVATSPPPLSWGRVRPRGVGEAGGRGLLRARCPPSPTLPPRPEQSGSTPASAPLRQIHLEGADERHGSDRLPGTRQAGAEGEFHRLGADDGPARVVVEQRSVGLLGAGGGLRGDRRGWRRSFGHGRPSAQPAGARPVRPHS